MDPATLTTLLLIAGGTQAATTLGSLWVDYKNAKKSDKANRRLSTLNARYGNMTFDEFNKLGTKQKRKFAAVHDRAARAGAVGSLGSSKSKIIKNTERNLKKQAEQQKQSIHQLPQYTKEQMKAIEKLYPGAKKFAKDIGLYRSTPGKVAQKMGKEGQKIDPKLKYLEDVAGLQKASLSTMEEPLPDYQNETYSKLAERLKGDVTSNYLQNILPDVKTAYAGQMDSSAYQQAVSKSEQDLNQDLGTILAQLGVESENLGLQKGSQEIQRRMLGIERGKLGLDQRRMGMEASAYLQGVKERSAAQWLGVRQQDWANRLSVMDRFLNSHPYSYMSSTHGFSPPFQSLPLPQPTNYTGQSMQGWGKLSSDILSGYINSQFAPRTA